MNELTKDLSLRPFIIFLHIHKCAGMTFQRDLLKLFGKPGMARAWDYFRKENHPDLIQSMKAMTMKDRYFSGHLSFGMHVHLPSPATYVTFLRDPVKRLISLYKYSSLQSNAYYHKLASRLGFTEFLLSGKGPLESDNGMTRFLAGGGSSLFIEDRKFGEVDEPLFDRAVSNLERYFSFIGVTESYDLSHVTFYRLLGLKPRPYFILNKARKAESGTLYTDSDLERIRELNKWDYQLYEHGTHLLKKQAFEALGITEADVAAFTRNNTAFNKRWGSMHNTMESFKQKVKSFR